jgi:hypothetical protein
MTVRMISPGQLMYANGLLDALSRAGKSDAAVAAYNAATGGNEVNIGSGGTGLRRRLPRITGAQASALIDALKVL